jgi:Leucine carboxyl methyltransferase
MNEEHPSVTAEGALIMRALHQILDDEPKVLDDPIAPQLINLESEFYKSRLELLERLPVSLKMRVRSGFVMRSRYTEDCLLESFGNGVRQYVLLGAGFDTFAWRQPPWAASLQVFEVDHPANTAMEIQTLRGTWYFSSSQREYRASRFRENIACGWLVDRRFESYRSSILFGAGSDSVSQRRGTRPDAQIHTFHAPHKRNRFQLRAARSCVADRRGGSRCNVCG